MLPPSKRLDHLFNALISSHKKVEKISQKFRMLAPNTTCTSDLTPEFMSHIS